MGKLRTNRALEASVKSNRGIILSLFEQESKDIFDAMVVPPNSARKTVINSLVQQLKDDGNWDELDTLWVMAAHDSQGGRLDWKDPSGTELTRINTPTFTVDEGYLGDGSSSYLQTGWNAQTQSVNFTRNDASFGIYLRTDLSEDRNDMGVLNSVPLYRGYLNSRAFGVCQVYVNTPTAAGAPAIVNSLGTISGKRTGAALGDTIQNGVSLGTNTNVSEAIPSFDPYILTRNNGGAPLGFSNKQASIVFYGSGAINHLTLHTAFNDYMTSLGKNVV